MYIKRILIVTSLLVAVTTIARAQEERELTVKPSGRILFDATYVHPKHQEDRNYGGTSVQCRFQQRPNDRSDVRAYGQ